MPRALLRAALVGCTLASLAGCTGSPSTPTEPTEPTAWELPAELTDPSGDVGGPRTFGGKYPPADLTSFRYGSDGTSLLAQWAVGEVLDPAGESRQTFGVDAATPEGDLLFSLRAAGSQFTIVDAAGFSRACPDATLETEEPTTADSGPAVVSASVPLSCLGEPARLQLTASVSVESSVRGGVSAFDLVSGQVSLDATDGTLLDAGPAGDSDEPQEDQ